MLTKKGDAMEDIMIGHELKKTSHLYKRKLDKMFNIHLNSNQRFIMNYVIDSFKNNKDVFQKDIERELNIRRSTATVMLQTLEKNNYIKRISVNYDARLKKIVPVKIVDKDEFKEVIISIEKQATKDIDQKDIDIFMMVLSKIKNNLEESECDNNDKKIS